jgi:hypothetical protein
MWLVRRAHLVASWPMRGVRGTPVGVLVVFLLCRHRRCSLRWRLRSLRAIPQLMIVTTDGRRCVAIFALAGMTTWLGRRLTRCLGTWWEDASTIWRQGMLRRRAGTRLVVFTAKGKVTSRISVGGVAYPWLLPHQSCPTASPGCGRLPAVLGKH